MKSHVAALVSVTLAVGVVLTLAFESMASEEEYSAKACVKIYQKMRNLKQHTSKAWSEINTARRQGEAIDEKLDAIQRERRQINCANDASLEPGNVKLCQRLTRQRLDLLAKQNAIFEKRYIAQTDYDRYLGDIGRLKPLHGRCEEAQSKRSRVKNLGCFAENRKIALRGLRGRVLSDDMIADNPAMTPQKCVTYCAGKGALYAGVQFGKWCFCGSGKYDAAGSSSACTKNCSGDPTQNCGGPYANRVFSTGIRK